MKIESTLNIGDLAWHSNGSGNAIPGTVGMVRVEIVDSPGVHTESMFDNYQPKHSYKEEYMLVETGIGSGSVYTLNKHIWETRQECLEAIICLKSTS